MNWHITRYPYLGRRIATKTDHNEDLVNNPSDYARHDDSRSNETDFGYFCLDDSHVSDSCLESRIKNFRHDESR